MPDRLDGEERRHNLLGILGGWWEEVLDTRHRIAYVAGFASLILVPIFYGGWNLHVLVDRYGPIPQQVEDLQEHQTIAERDFFPKVDSLSGNVDSLRTKIERVQSAVGVVHDSISTVRRIGLENNCLIRALAKGEDAFTCGGR